MSEQRIVARWREGGPRDVVVLGTSELRPACDAAGIGPKTHQWGRVYYHYRGWVLHRDGTASLMSRGTRPGILFIAVRAREDGVR
jgi:hypothetical protein